MGKTIIIGLDGVPHSLITRFTSNGTMPHLADIIKCGVLRKMESAIPEVSCVAWSTAITGKNAGCHGIYGFMNLAPHSYNFCFPNFTDLKVPAFWEEGKLREGRSAIINVPATYPARPLNGILVSGFVAIDFGKAITPPALVPELRALDYRIDVDAARGHRDMNAFLRDLNDTLEARVRAYRALWQKESWDLFFLVFTGTDRLGHFLFEAFENERHTHRGAFVDYFRKIDAAIGEIYERCDKDDLFIMLSDHGFGVIDREVNVNYFLREKGLLKVVDPQPDSFNAVESDSKVFALDPARIYVHRKGKFPRGNVKPEDEEKVIEDVIAALKDLTVDGKPVARRIVRREEIYSGPFIADAPDIVIIPAGGFDLKARLVARELTAKGIFTGKHTQDDAFLFMRAPGLAENDIPATPWVGDLRTIVERYS